MEARPDDTASDEYDRPARPGRVVRWLVVIAVVVGLLFVMDRPRQIGALAWGRITGKPPLRIARTGDLFIADVQTLGEYKASIARIRLRREGEVVWEVKAAGHVPQIWTFGLRVGENRDVRTCGGGAPQSCDGDLLRETYQTVQPRTGSFVIEHGAPYVLEVWGSDSWWARTSVALEP